MIDYDFCNIAKLLDQPKGVDTDVGKRLFWGDLMLNSARVFDEDYAGIFKNAAEKIEESTDRNDIWKDYYEYTKLCFLVVLLKAEVVSKLQKAYKNGDKFFLRLVYESILPELKNAYIKLERLHRKMWLDTYKPFSYQRTGARYGAQLTRIDYTLECITEYLEGKISSLPEIEEEQLRYEGDKSKMEFFSETVQNCKLIRKNGVTPDIL